MNPVATSFNAGQRDGGQEVSGCVQIFIKKSISFISIKPSPDHIGNVDRDISSTY
jgi:hypothetical protein